MTCICRGLCDLFRKLHPEKCLKHLKQKRFMQGWKWCKLCRIGIRTDDKYCFCCSLQMRVRTRSRAVFEDVLPEPRTCVVCDGMKTYTGIKGYQVWKRYGDAYICTTCDCYIQYRKKRDPECGIPDKKIL